MLNQKLPDQSAELIALAETAVAAQNLDEFSTAALTHVSTITATDTAFLYVQSPSHPPVFYHQALPADLVAPAQALCAQHVEQPPATTQLNTVLAGDPTTYPITLYPLIEGSALLGLGETTEAPDLPAPLRSILTHTLQRWIEHDQRERQIAHLNTYQTVSSMLAQSLGLDEMMETILYCCQDAVQAEAASILLLDDEKQHFYFYQIEGPAKLDLMTARMPADQGIAGAVLKSGQPEIVNDLPTDTRHYQAFDTQANFVPRNMLVIPLMAGEERIGVLEVLNKRDDQPFTPDELLTMMMFAEEIAFAIRNARIFEYVVNSYCKQRQGLHTCKGCERPLGSWTPCVKYRATGTWRIVAS